LRAVWLRPGIAKSVSNIAATSRRDPVRQPPGLTNPEDTMNRMILPLVALLASTTLAFAEPVRMTDTQLDNVVAGWNGGGNDCGNAGCENNGWGNGWDGNNPGSFSPGPQGPSKLANGDAYPITNPTTSTGR
jgi:hypothetical protein